MPRRWRGSSAAGDAMRCRHSRLRPPESAMSTLSTLLNDAAARSAAGDGAGALAAYREAVKIAPERAELWHNLGALHAFQGASDEALAAFAEAARRRVTWAEPWSARGHVLFAAGDLDGARAAF